MDITGKVHCFFEQWRDVVGYDGIYQVSNLGNVSLNVWDAKGASQAGLCSEERSMISPDYARNFICDFIIGKKQPELSPQMEFDF